MTNYEVMFIIDPTLEEAKKEATIETVQGIIAKDGVYKPMPLAMVEDCYGYSALPEGFKYVGVLYRSVLASKPAAAIMTWGEVNIEAVPFAMDTIMDAFTAECRFIDFKKDEEA